MASGGFCQKCDLDRSEVLQDCGTAAAAICATTCTNKLLSRFAAEGSRFAEPWRLSVVGMSSTVWDRKVCAKQPTGPGSEGPGSVGHKFLVSCKICWVTGTGGAFLAAARARPRSLDWASVVTLRARDCLCSAADLVVPLEMGPPSHSVRTMDHRAGQSSRASRKREQLMSDAMVAGRPTWSQLLSTRTFRLAQKLGRRALVQMARRMAC